MNIRSALAIHFAVSVFIFAILTPASIADDTNVKLSAGISAMSFLNADFRSDSSVHPINDIDCISNLKLNRLSWTPHFSVEFFSEKGGGRGGISGWCTETSGSTVIGEQLNYDGRSFSAGESLDSVLNIFSFSVFGAGNVLPKKSKSKLYFGGGFKDYHLELEIRGGSSGNHVDALNIPMIFFDMQGHHALNETLSLLWNFRIGFLLGNADPLWYNKQVSWGAFNPEGQGIVHTKITENLRLETGVKFEWMKFAEAKSHDRRKEANLGFVSGFVSIMFVL